MAQQDPTVKKTGRVVSHFPETEGTFPFYTMKISYGTGEAETTSISKQVQRNMDEVHRPGGLSRTKSQEAYKMAT